MAAAAELQMATAAAALQEMIELAWAGGEASIVVEEGILRRSAKMHLQLKVVRRHLKAKFHLMAGQQQQVNFRHHHC